MVGIIKRRWGAVLDEDDFASDSAVAPPSQQSTKAYIDAAIIAAGAGDVVGPASSTDGHLAQFDGTTGKKLKGGLALDTDAALAADSDTRVPSQKAVKAYVGGAVPTTEEIQDIAGAMWTGNTETFISITYQDSDGTIDAVVPVKDEDDMSSDSAAHLATQQSIKAYVDTAVGSVSAPVSSVFGRTGAVTAATSDYDASQIDNDSGVTGSTVKDALDELDDSKQPLDADLTAIAALTTTAAGRSALVVADPGADRLMFWDDSAGELSLDNIKIAINSNPSSLDSYFGRKSDGSLQRVPGDALSGAAHYQVYAATTGNITLPTVPSILDGVHLSNGDRVLVKNQTAAAENGIYIVGTTLTRAGDFGSYDDHCGVLISVQDGSTNKNTVWRGTSSYGGFLDITGISFAQVPVSASELLTSIKTVDGSGSGLDADTLDGNEASAFAASSHTHASTDITDFAEAVSDQVGSMVSGNTETFISVTYQDADNTMDFVVPVLDEDDMASDSASHLATQQSIKAYVDAAVAAGGAPMPSSDGIIVRTSSTTTAARTIEAGDGISVSDGDGVSDNPTVSVDSSVARLSGATFTGNVSVSGTGAVDRYVTALADAGRNRGFILRSDGGLRWIVSGDSAAESGSNVGTDFNILRYADNSSFLGYGLRMRRASGATILGTPTGLYKGDASLNVEGTVYENNVEVAKLTGTLGELAALTTTSFGRGLLTLADAAALRSGAEIEHGSWTPICTPGGNCDAVSANGPGAWLKIGAGGAGVGIAAVDLSIDATVAANLCSVTFTLPAGAQPASNFSNSYDLTGVIGGSVNSSGRIRANTSAKTVLIQTITNTTSSAGMTAVLMWKL